MKKILLKLIFGALTPEKLNKKSEKSLRIFTKTINDLQKVNVEIEEASEDTSNEINALTAALNSKKRIKEELRLAKEINTARIDKIDSLLKIDLFL